MLRERWHDLDLIFERWKERGWGGASWSKTRSVTIKYFSDVLSKVHPKGTGTFGWPPFPCIERDVRNLDEANGWCRQPCI